MATPILSYQAPGVLVNVPYSIAAARLRALYLADEPPEQVEPPITRIRTLRSSENEREDEYYLVLDAVDIVCHVHQEWIDCQARTTIEFAQQPQPNPLPGIFTAVYGEVQLAPDGATTSTLVCSWNVILEFADDLVDKETEAARSHLAILDFVVECLLKLKYQLEESTP